MSAQAFVYGRTDGRTDGQTDRRTDGRTDGRQADRYIPRSFSGRGIKSEGFAFLFSLPLKSQRKVIKTHAIKLIGTEI